MRRLPPLHALRAFEAAARHMNFTKAAVELGLTPTAISHQVRLLEDFMGKPLFRRRPRPLTLTPEAAHLFPVLRDGLDRFAAAVSELKRMNREEPLVMSVPHSFGSRWLLPRLRDLKAATGLDLAMEADDRIVDLHAGTVDCAIRYVRDRPPELISHDLFNDRLIPVCAPSLLTKHSPIECASDVLRLPLIHFRWKTKRPDAPSWDRWLLEAAKVDSRAVNVVPPKGGLRVSEEIHAIEAALAGEGVSLASDVEVALDISAKRLVMPIDVGIVGFMFRVAHLRSHPRASDIALFANWARKAANDVAHC